MMANQETIIAAAKTAQYGGASGAVFFGLTANEFAAIAGVAIALIGAVVGNIIKHRQAKAEIAEMKRHHAAMEAKGE